MKNKNALLAQLREEKSSKLSGGIYHKTQIALLKKSCFRRSNVRLTLRAR